MRVQINLFAGHLQIETTLAVTYHQCRIVASITHTRSKVRANAEVLKEISNLTRVVVGAPAAASTQASSVIIELLMAVTLMKALNMLVVFLPTKNWRQITPATWLDQPLITTIKSSLLWSKTNLLINSQRSKKNWVVMQTIKLQKRSLWQKTRRYRLSHGSLFLAKTPF